MTFTTFVRSSLFALLQLAATPIFAVVALLTFPLPALARYRVIGLWSRLMLAGVRIVCGIHYRVVGAEHIPRTASIVLSKHQSAWETIAFQTIFPPQVWVIKRELLWVPFFGWGLAMLQPIAIDRSAGGRALAQMLEQGRDRLERGFWIVIFPEGTRVAPGARRKYQAGGAWLAVKPGTTSVPVAHKAGEYWGRNAFIKRAGTITVSVGEPITAGDCTPAELTARVEHWIENEMQRIAQHG